MAEQICYKDDPSIFESEYSDDEMRKIMFGEDEIWEK
jgi:hypothetical protein